MFTGIYALEWVVGAEIWLGGCIVCLLLACLIAFAIRTNRGRRNVRITLASIAASALACDIVWFFVYFPQGEYRNMGLGAAAGLLLCPLCLAAGVVAASLVNRARREKD